MSQLASELQFCPEDGSKGNRQQFKEEKKKGWIHMGNNDSSVETFLQWIKASDNIVFFGGAGVSTESGIPDFRSVDGLYNQKYDYPPETIHFTGSIRRNFTASTVTRCSALMQSRTSRITSWQSLKKPENLRVL